MQCALCSKRVANSQRYKLRKNGLGSVCAGSVQISDLKTVGDDSYCCRGCYNHHCTNPPVSRLLRFAQIRGRDFLKAKTIDYLHIKL